MAAVWLPSLVDKRATAWPAAMRDMLPGKQSTRPPEQLWAPVVAWLVLRSLHGDRVEVFDQLQLRSALAEIFESMGIAGEDRWRAAARVRVLLAFEPAPPVKQSPTLLKKFWEDPDVRWLAGISESHGIVYFNRECFEEMLCWLQLPALILSAQERAEPLGLMNKVKALASNLSKARRAAHDAGYKVDTYLSSATKPPAIKTKPMR